MQKTLIPLLLILLLAACAPAAANEVQFDNPYAPQPGDRDLKRGEIEIQAALVASTRSLPPQILIQFTYLPQDVCYRLRVTVTRPDEQNRILIDAYGVTEAEQACMMMMPLAPQDIRLNIGSFPDGAYTVWLNGRQIGEFNSLNP